MITNKPDKFNTNGTINKLWAKYMEQDVAQLERQLANIQCEVDHVDAYYTDVIERINKQFKIRIIN